MELHRERGRDRVPTGGTAAIAALDDSRRTCCLSTPLVPFLFALALAPGAVFAQPCPALDIRNPDGNYIVPGVKGDIPYAGDLALDAYIQQGPGPRPSVVVIHGGTWTSGSRAAHVGQILEVLTRASYNWFSIDYRLGGLPGYEQSLADIRRALGFIRCHARELRTDPDRLVLLGEDSGAHLVALLAAQPPAGMAGAVLVGGFFDLPAIPGIVKGVDGELLARASPIATGVKVPLLLVHGEADTEVPVDQARRFCREVEAARRQCQLVDVKGASHRSENWWPNQWTYKRELAAWLSKLVPVPRGAHQPYARTRLLKDIVYDKTRDLKLDAFIPRTTRPVPAVIIVHGGGWEAGDKVTYVTPLFEPLARAGLAWFSIDYRLTPASTHEEQLTDLRAAIRFIRAGHTRFNIDPARIVLVGESASGQMVTQIATEDASLSGVVSFYGVYDFPAMVSDASPRSLLVRLFRRHALDDESREVLKRYSPLYRAHGNMPPMLLVNGTGERLWAQAQAFARRLSDLGVSHEVIALDGAPHGLENWEGRAEWTTYKRRLVEWIRQIVVTRQSGMRHGTQPGAIQEITAEVRAVPVGTAR
jgi:alpha-L-fucosidase 2